MTRRVIFCTDVVETRNGINTDNKGHGSSSRSSRRFQQPRRHPHHPCECGLGRTTSCTRRWRVLEAAPSPCGVCSALQPSRLQLGSLHGVVQGGPVVLAGGNRILLPVADAQLASESDRTHVGCVISRTLMQSGPAPHWPSSSTLWTLMCSRLYIRPE